jgi:hypothetical protein
VSEKAPIPLHYVIDGREGTITATTGGNVFKYSLGQVVRDKLTKFQGIVMARTEYHTGCITYGVMPKELTKDGKPKDWEWLDETRLESTSKSKKLEKGIGGPQPRPPQS